MSTGWHLVTIPPSVPTVDVYFNATVLTSELCSQIMQKAPGTQAWSSSESATQEELFKNEKQCVINPVLSVVYVLDVAKIIADYVVSDESYFGAEEWRKYYGMDVGHTPPLSKQCRRFWNSPDPIDPTKRVYQTHLPPVLRPRFVRDISTNHEFAFNLKLLGKLVKSPLKGHRCHFFEKNLSGFRFPGQEMDKPAAPACWLVMRKEVCARNPCIGNPLSTQISQLAFITALNQRTQSDYEVNPWGIDIAVVLFTRYLLTKERYLGDETGMEKQRTYIVIGNEKNHCGTLIGGLSASKGLGIAYQSRVRDEIAIIGIQKF